MHISPSTESYLTDVEQFTGKKFRYRPEIGMLLEASSSPGEIEIFDEVIFYAKFLSHARGILTRSGLDSEETKKLAQEFSAKLEVASALLKSLAGGVPQDQQQYIQGKFFAMSEASMRELIELLKELSWIKNYRLDVNGRTERS